MNDIRRAWTAAGWLAAVAAGPHGIALKLVGIGLLIMFEVYRRRTASCG